MEKIENLVNSVVSTEIYTSNKRWDILLVYVVMLLARVEGKKNRLHQNKLLFCNNYSKSVLLEILHFKPLQWQIIIWIIQGPHSDVRRGQVMLGIAILLEFFMVFIATDIVKGLVTTQFGVPQYCTFSSFFGLG